MVYIHDIGASGPATRLWASYRPINPGESRGIAPGT
jgi:hypothetical protein